MTNQFLTFAGDPGADVMSYADYSAPGFTARHLGFSTGTALSIQLNTVWRQASLMTHMLGEFVKTEANLDMLDNGTPAGITALQNHFTAAVSAVALKVDAGYLPLKGGTLTGPLIINSTAIGQLQIHAAVGQHASINLSRNAGQIAGLVAYTGTTTAGARWNVNLADAAPETGANAGSNFSLARYADAGGTTPIDFPITISRQTGVVNFAHAPTVAGGPLPYLPLAGGTLHGPLTITGDTVELRLNAAQGENSVINLTRYKNHIAAIVSYSEDSLSGRWNMQLATSEPETGNNAGSNFVLARYSDANQFIDNPIQISRATGVVTFAHPPVWAGSDNQSLPYLPLSGGTVSGNLTVTGSSMLGNVALGSKTDFVLYSYTGGGSDIRALQWKTGTNSGVVDYLDAVANMRVWQTNGQPTMYLDQYGTLRTQGALETLFGRVISYTDIASNAGAVVAAIPGHANGMWTDATGLWFGLCDSSGNPSKANLCLRESDGLLVSYANIYAAGYVSAVGAGFFTGGVCTSFIDVHQSGIVIRGGGWLTLEDGIGATIAGAVTIGGDLSVQGNIGTNANIGTTNVLVFEGSNGGLAAVFAGPDFAALRFMGGYPQFQQLGISGWGGVLCYNTQWHPDGGGAWSCDIAGNSVNAGACYATAYPGPSDGTLKTDIEAWGVGLDVIEQIEPVSYKWREDAKLGTPGQTYYGVTAQALKAVLPEAVTTMKRYTHKPATQDGPAAEETFDEILAVESATILYACVNAIKEMAARLKVLEAKDA